jgi:hypothetical protein
MDDPAGNARTQGASSDMNPDDRAEAVAQEWAKRLAVPPEAGDVTDLAHLIGEQIASALADEVEACAAVVERHLQSESYPPDGIPKALRDRKGWREP